MANMREIVVKLFAVCNQYVVDVKVFIV